MPYPLLRAQSGINRPLREREARGSGFGPQGHTGAKQPAPKLSTKVPLHYRTRLTPKPMSHSGFNSTHFTHLIWTWSRPQLPHRSCASAGKYLLCPQLSSVFCFHGDSKALPSTCQGQPHPGPPGWRASGKAHIVAPSYENPTSDILGVFWGLSPENSTRSGLASSLSIPCWDTSEPRGWV